jgi:D-alanyl-D-alanine dipeptidase
MRSKTNLFALLLLIPAAVATAQTIGPAPEVVPVPAATAPAPPPEKQEPLVIIRDLAEYERLAAADPDKQLVDLSTLRIPVDVRYATPLNFMHKKLYPVAKAYLRAPVARALAAANAELNAEGVTLLVWDAYRPYRVTVEMWEKIRNPDYVADPAQGSRHNRGAAVDVTLRSLNPTSRFMMPTFHDDFSERASHSFMRFPKDTLAYRKKLRTIMEKHGFEAFESEWWHYDFKGWERFELMDVGLDQLSATATSPGSPSSPRPSSSPRP